MMALKAMNSSNHSLTCDWLKNPLVNFAATVKVLTHWNETTTFNATCCRKKISGKIVHASCFMFQLFVLR